MSPAISSDERRACLASALDNPPFPWQERLLDAFIAGTVPRALDLPTGLGKTSVMAIWLAARALGSEKPLPRRLVYVVDRRAIVDQATSEAMKLREWASTMADALELGDRALPLSTLRGQFADNREWMEDPASPAILVGTVDMIGSRILFEGYACSRKMRPYQAGLLGCDTLFVLDEAHLVPPFERLLEQVCANGELWPETTALDQTAQRPMLLSLSATGRQRADGVFRLSSEDEEHETVKQRIHATKRLSWQDLESSRKLAEALAAEAWQLATQADGPQRVLVFSNKREDAEAAKDALLRIAKRDLEKGTPLPRAELFVGARRGRERGLAEKQLCDLGFLAGSSPPLDHTFLFATSAGEVGVDLDASHAVADVVAWERVIQRLGRVNRRGGGEARVVLIADPESQWSERVRPLFDALPLTDDGYRSGNSAALIEIRERPELAEAIATATTPEPAYPPLELPIVEAWAMTSLREHTGRPEVQPWLRGWEPDDPPQTTVVWRNLTEIAGLGEGFDRVLSATPPHPSERLETETFRVAEWLKRRAAVLDRQRNADPELGVHPRSIVAVGLDRAEETVYQWTLNDLLATNDKRLQRLLGGQTIIVDARLGGLSEDGLLSVTADGPASTGETGEWIEAHVPFWVRVEHVDDPPSAAAKGWRERLRVPCSQAKDTEQVTKWVVVYNERGSDSATEDGRSVGNAQLLVEHQAWAADEATRLGRLLGLPAALSRLLTLAARLHDEGKRAERWQRAFNAPRTGIYAKTRPPLHLQLLGGYRHEFGSLPLAQEDPEFLALAADEQELVLHLIAAHHGFARPVIGTRGCDDAPPSVVEGRAREVALRFVQLQSRFGPWRLAWLEALLRAADQRASRANDERDEA